MFLKRLFYAAATILCLALAYHFGARSVQAQSGSFVTGMSIGTIVGQPMMFVMTANGDCYARAVSESSLSQYPARSLGNFWAGAPTAIESETWGGIKAKFKK